MNLQKQIKQIAITGLGTYLGLGLYFGNASPQNAHAGTRVECMGGTTTTTLDLKLVEEPLTNALIIARERTTIKYGSGASSHIVNHFTSLLAGYQWMNGWYLDGEVQLTPDAGVVPKLGIEYSRALGGNSILDVLTTGNISHDPLVEITIYASHQPPSGEKGIMATFEGVTNWGNQGHNFSIQRVRLGKEQQQYQGGIAADLLQDQEGRISSSLGIFIAKRF